jgi:hypothetical protein
MMLLENIYRIVITHDDYHMATEVVLNIGMFTRAHYNTIFLSSVIFKRNEVAPIGKRKI